MKINREKLKKYEGIIHEQHPVFQDHPPMERSKRAAQFAPFAALTGYEAAILEAQKRMEEKWEDEYEVGDQTETGQDDVMF